mmetsp:Transcript_25004/g.60155  ORF Transcript_25004/g.60155 Transcript_25004/m.60155 type:complete len:275 (-) Transcript_25004:600-1424(-)
MRQDPAVGEDDLPLPARGDEEADVARAGIQDPLPQPELGGGLVRVLPRGLVGLRVALEHPGADRRRGAAPPVPQCVDRLDDLNQHRLGLGLPGLWGGRERLGMSVSVGVGVRRARRRRRRRRRRVWPLRRPKSHHVLPPLRRVLEPPLPVRRLRLCELLALLPPAFVQVVVPAAKQGGGGGGRQAILFRVASAARGRGGLEGRRQRRQRGERVVRLWLRTRLRRRRLPLPLGLCLRPRLPLRVAGEAPWVCARRRLPLPLLLLLLLLHPHHLLP